jgi:hypothetical protein
LSVQVQEREAVREFQVIIFVYRCRLRIKTAFQIFR